MKLIAINGSPRKKWNTATMLEHALKGAEDLGASTSLVHLYDLQFKGCTSCFACKLKDGKNHGKCAFKDELSPILAEIAEADALIMGSPIYFGAATGEFRSFLERLLFAPLVYDKPLQTLFPKRLPVGLVYTMNVDEEMCAQRYQGMISATEASVSMLIGPVRTLCAYDTLQFPDYSKVIFGYADPLAKTARNRTIFPEVCRKAYSLGQDLLQM